MDNKCELLDFELICVIVNFGWGTKVLTSAKKIGLPGGTIFLGNGTVRNKFLEFLDLSDVRKEVVLMLAEKTKAEHAIKELDKKYSFEKPNHGIAFTISVKDFIGCKKYDFTHDLEEVGAENIMSHAIFVIVERGKAENVIEAATKAGSRGGTIINARGSGIHETQTFFAMPVEPEKEIVIILAEKTTTEKISEAIRSEINIDLPGNGIMFVLDVNKTYGLF